MNKIKMYWWNDEPNFGDALNPLLLEKVFKLKVEWSGLSTARLVGAGSCLQWVAKAVKEKPHEMLIWGTGYIFDQEPYVDSSQVKHLAVRGVKSRMYGRLRDDTLMGDPGLLAPLFFEKPIHKKYRVGIVPHLWNICDKELDDIKSDHPEVKIIDVREDALKVIMQIAECDFIFSSSLHGLVIADSFGIPNQWVTFKEIPFGGSWKFLDYYLVFSIKTPAAIEFDTSILTDSMIANYIDDFDTRTEGKLIQENLVGVLAETLL